MAQVEGSGAATSLTEQTLNMHSRLILLSKLIVTRGAYLYSQITFFSNTVGKKYEFGK